MIIPDVNLLLYATDSQSPFHSKTRKWWQDILQENAPIGFCAPVVFAYLRLATHPKITHYPLSVAMAFTKIDEWMQFPSAQWLVPDDSHLSRVKSLLLEAGTGGNLVTDAQIAAYGQQYNGTVYSADLDFNRFQVKWKNPLSAR